MELLRRPRRGRVALAPAAIALEIAAGAGRAWALDPYEPNDTPARATPIRAPFSADRLNIASAADADVFRLEARASDELLARVHDAAGFVPRVEVLDATGAVIATQDPRHDPGAVVAVLPADGTCYVRVTPDRPIQQGDRGDYDLDVQLASGAPDALEPNDAPATATRVPTPRFESAALTIAPAGDVDVFAAAARAGDLATVSAELIFPLFRTETFSLTPLVTIADGAGNVLAGPAPRVAQARVPAGGDLLFTVAGVPAFLRGPYRARVQVESRLAPDAYEPNGTLAAATRLDPRPERSLEANLDRGDLDLFRVDACAGTELSATAFDTYGRAAPRLVLLDAAGAPLTFAGTAVLPADGAYYLAVTSADDVALRGATTLQYYGLSVRAVAPPRVVAPGHTSTFVAPALAAAERIASDPTTGDLYALDRGAAWSLSRMRGGVVTSLRASVASPYAGGQLVVRRGFGGADLFSSDAAGRVVSFRAGGDGGCIFAQTSGTVGLTFARGLLWASASRAISAVSAGGVVAPFMGADRLSSDPASLAASPDGELLHFANARSEVVTIDLPSATEVSRASVGPGDLQAPAIAVEPVSGDVFALVRAADGAAGVRDLARYHVADGAVTPFAERLPGASDLTFGPCGDPTARPWCLFVATSRGLMKIDGFTRPFDVLDPTGDGAPDLIGLDAGHVDLLAAGSSTHLVVTAVLTSPLAPGAEVRVAIDHGETPALSADVEVSARRLAGGALSWRGIGGLAAYSRVEGSEVRFAIPIGALRSRSTPDQRHAGADRILIWASTAGDRAPDQGALVARGYFPIVELIPTRLDFGGVRAGTRAVLPLAIANLGAGALELSRVTISGAAFGLLDVPLEVPESATAILRVICEPRARGGTLRSEVRIASASPAVVRTVPVTCRAL